jgi:hypothetical protein
VAVARLLRSTYLTRVGNVQRKVRAAGKRQEAVRLCQAGVPSEKIAAQLGVSTRMVQKYLTTFLQTDCKFPVGLNASEIELMRCEQREHVEGFQRALLRQREKLEAITLYSPEEATAVSSALAKLSDSFMRSNERLASMFGLDAREPQPAPANVTNNNLVLVSPIIERIKQRRLAQAGAIELPEVSSRQVEG